MGAKGSKVQTVTRDFDVQIKFPDKAAENGEMPAAPRPDRSSNPDIIRITGTGTFSAPALYLSHQGPALLKSTFFSRCQRL
jgi:hypothetical protein